MSTNGNNYGTTALLEISGDEKLPKFKTLKELNTQTDKKKELIKALSYTLGIVSYACQLVGCSRQTFYDYKNSDKKFLEAWEDTTHIVEDFVRLSLYRNIAAQKEITTIYASKVILGLIEKTEMQLKHQVKYVKSTFEFIPEGEPLEIIGFEDPDPGKESKKAKKKKKKT